MPSSIAFNKAVDDVGRFIDRAERMPQQTRATVENTHARLMQAAEQIVELSKKNKEIYVDDVAVGPQARNLVSFLM